MSLFNKPTGYDKVKKCFCRSDLKNSSVVPEFQRELDQKHVDSIYDAIVSKDENTRFVVIGTPIIAICESKKYIIDGQHRIAALTRLCSEGKHIPFTYQYSTFNEEEKCFQAYKCLTSYNVHSEVGKTSENSKQAIFNKEAEKYLDRESKLKGFKFGSSRPLIRKKEFLETFAVHSNYELGEFKRLLNGINKQIKDDYENETHSYTKGSHPTDRMIDKAISTEFYFVIIKHDLYDRMFRNVRHIE